MELKSPENNKLILNFIINEKPELLLKLEPSLLDHQDIQNVLSIFIEYFKDYHQIIPTNILLNEIIEKGYNIKPSLLNQMILTDIEWTELKNKRGNEKIEKIFKDKHLLWFNSNRVNKDIDLVRNSKEDISKIKELNENYGYISPLEDDEELDEPEALKNTDYIPDELYNNLPKFLKDTCSYFEGRERDVFFTGELIVLSALFENVSGLYGTPTKSNNSNLYAFIAAPASNGKGVLNLAKDTLHKIHEKEIENNKLNKLKYPEEERKNYKDKYLLLPGNASASAFISEMKNNDGKCLVLETEADVISSTRKQDWGDYDFCLRMAFHHESVQLIRKEGRIEIPKSYISFVASGTIEQLIRFIPSTENGLFSRFIYYTFKQDPVFKNPWKSDKDYEQIFKNQFGSELLDIYEFYKRYSDKNEVIKFNFELTEKQRNIFIEKFSEKLEESYSFLLGGDITGSILRLGLITFRLAMILSILRYYENNKDDLFNKIDNEIICNDIDFDTFMIVLIIPLKI